MWIAHFAPGLVAKPLAPGIPLWLLALAGTLPDAAFFVLSFADVSPTLRITRSATLCSEWPSSVRTLVLLSSSTSKSLKVEAK
jgi:hypothetical protein